MSLFKPELMVVEEGRTRKAKTQGVCLKAVSTAGSLEGFKRSFQGSVHGSDFPEGSTRHSEERNREGVEEGDESRSMSSKQEIIDRN